jgi:hypothetical protein
MYPRATFPWNSPNHPIKLLNSPAPAGSSKESAQKKPYIGGAGANHEHNDYVILKAEGKSNMSVISADCTHKKAQDCKICRKRASGRSILPESLPKQAH